MLNEKLIRPALIAGSVEVAWPVVQAGRAFFLRVAVKALTGKTDPVWVHEHTDLIGKLAEIYEERLVLRKSLYRTSWVYFRMHPQVYKQIHIEVLKVWHMMGENESWYKNLICVKSSLDASMRRSEGRSSKRLEKLFTSLRTSLSQPSCSGTGRQP